MSAHAQEFIAQIIVHLANSNQRVHISLTISEGKEVRTASITTPIQPMDIPSGDNLTHLVAIVMPHDIPCTSKHLVTGLSD